MSHLFKFPRKINPAVAERYDMLRKHGKSRRAMIDFVCGIGGYSDGYGRWPIEFNVKMYPDLDADTLWKIVRDECEFDIKGSTPQEQVVAENLFREMHTKYADNLWGWAQEDMVRSAREDAYFYGDWLGDVHRIGWELRGRCGGHLVLEEVGNISLAGKTDDDLREQLEEKEDGRFVTALEDIQELFVVCIELTVTTRGKSLEAECQYHAASRLWSNICEPKWEERMTEYATREALKEDAERIRVHLGNTYPGDGLTGTFDTICRLAGINLE